MKQKNEHQQDKDCKRLADSILSLAPDIPLDGIEVQAGIKAQGVDPFLRRYAPELSEVKMLLSRLEKRGLET